MIQIRGDVSQLARQKTLSRETLFEDFIGPSPTPYELVSTQSPVSSIWSNTQGERAFVTGNKHSGKYILKHISAASGDPVSVAVANNYDVKALNQTRSGKIVCNKSLTSLTHHLYTDRT
jgi:hypothetical protein